MKNDIFINVSSIRIRIKILIVFVICRIFNKKNLFWSGVGVYLKM